MDPFEGQRRLEIRAEQVVWHLVSAGVCGVLVLLLLFSVALLDDAGPQQGGPEAPPKIARPVEEGGHPEAVLETGLRETRPRPPRPPGPLAGSAWQDLRGRIGGGAT